MPSGFDISKATGQIRFPNGRLVSSDALAEDFKGGDDEPLIGGEGWVTYKFSGGDLDEKAVYAFAAFKATQLRRITFAISCYPADARGWENYSLDFEAAAKELHDAILTNLLGPPHEVRRHSKSDWPDAVETLLLSKFWRYCWGRIVSSHDERGGGTSVLIRYE